MLQWRSFIFILSFGVSATAGAGELPLSCFLFQGLNTSSHNSFGISDHHPVLKTCESSEGSKVAIRQFQSAGRSYVLLVHPQTLKTQIVDRSCLRCSDSSISQLPESNYKSALKKQLSAPFPLANKGIAHAEPQLGGYFLSMDLCPSKKSFNIEVFQNHQVRAQKHFPVAIAITGGWMKRYPQDFEWLKNQTVQGQLDITWVNHSYTHPYNRAIPNNKNFLLMSGVNFADEVLKQEQYMISAGLTPSAFFRFPGLISDQQLITQLSSYGLLSLGSDAWLALGQRPKAGSVILIHGNGNEPQGVSIFLQLLQNISNLEVFRPLTQVFQ